MDNTIAYPHNRSTMIVICVVPVKYFIVQWISA